MNQQERDEFREKHQPLILSEGKDRVASFCKGCASSNGSLTVIYPCDAIKMFELMEKREVVITALRERLKFIEENLSSNTIVRTSKLIYSNEDFDL